MTNCWLLSMDGGFLGKRGRRNVKRLTSNVANASKRGQRLLADYAEREHFRADAVWSNVAGRTK